MGRIGKPGLPECWRRRFGAEPVLGCSGDNSAAGRRDDVWTSVRGQPAVLMTPQLRWLSWALMAATIVLLFLGRDGAALVVAGLAVGAVLAGRYLYRRGA